jgi:hypothetical protein
MDPQHPNQRGERGLRALTSSPVVPAPPSRHRRPAVLGTPSLTATRSTIGSCCEPGHAIRDGADAGEPIAAAVRITRQEWRRRWQRSPGIVTGRLPERPIGDAGEQVVNRHLVAAVLGRLTQEHRDVLRECYFLGQLGCAGRAWPGDRARHGEVPHLLCAACAAAGHRRTTRCRVTADPYARLDAVYLRPDASP